MRSLVVIAPMLLTLTTAAVAGEPWWDQMNNEQKREYCQTLGAAAGMTMVVRQQGVPFDEVIKSERDPLAAELIRRAYEYPQHNTEEKRKEAIDAFGKKNLDDCLRKIPAK